MELEDEMQKMQEEFQEAAKKLAADKDAEIEQLNSEMEDLRKKKRQVEEYLEEKASLEQQMADMHFSIHLKHSIQCYFNPISFPTAYISTLHPALYSRASSPTISCSPSFTHAAFIPC
eukprot:scaffold223223_cov25-Prasinocladus_malaysianus.AAC.1